MVAPWHIIAVIVELRVCLRAFELVSLPLSAVERVVKLKVQPSVSGQKNENDLEVLDDMVAFLYLLCVLAVVIAVESKLIDISHTRYLLVLMGTVVNVVAHLLVSVLIHCHFTQLADLEGALLLLFHVLLDDNELLIHVVVPFLALCMVVITSKLLREDDIELPLILWKVEFILCDVVFLAVVIPFLYCVEFRDEVPEGFLFPHFPGLVAQITSV